jgi:phosphatidylethanolamine-binding protein (PEBP) family uncharacterized protein
MQLTSSTFAEGAPIPAKYTANEKDVSPPLKWMDLKPGAIQKDIERAMENHVLAQGQLMGACQSQ